MKAMIPILVILALVASHEDATREVNLTPGQDNYNVPHDCDGSKDNILDFVIVKNDLFTPYSIIINDKGKVKDEKTGKYEETCYYMVTCDLCCRKSFFDDKSNQGKTRFQFTVSDGNYYSESINLKFLWDPEGDEVDLNEDCL